MSSSGPDGNRAWLQVGAGALKHCVASGCLPEATLLLEAIMARRSPMEYPSQLQVNTSLPLAVITLSGNRDRSRPSSCNRLMTRGNNRAVSHPGPAKHLPRRPPHHDAPGRPANRQRDEPAPVDSHPRGRSELQKVVTGGATATLVNRPGSGGVSDKLLSPYAWR